MTSIDMTPLTDDMLARLAITHRPTFEYITERRANGIPTAGVPRKQPEPVPEYRAPRITKEQAAAEYWRALLDLALVSNSHPARQQIEHEANTWHRFATHNSAF